MKAFFEGFEESEAYRGIADLWQRVFGDEEETVSSFYRSFDLSGNVFTAVKNSGGIVLTSDLRPDGGKIVGLVNRVPLKLRTGGKTIAGGYIYAGCVDPDYRGRGIYGGLMRQAEKDMAFTVLIPADEPLFGMYLKLGYVKTAGTPFPHETEGKRLEDIRTEPFDGDYDLLYRFYLSGGGDRFIKSRPFFAFTLADFAGQGSIFYITDRQGERTGYIVRSEIKNTVKIYELFCLPGESCDIINADIIKTGKYKVKSMVRGITEAPGLHIFGEY